MTKRNWNCDSSSFLLLFFLFLLFALSAEFDVAEEVEDVLIAILTEYGELLHDGVPDVAHHLLQEKEKGMRRERE